MTRHPRRRRGKNDAPVLIHLLEGRGLLEIGKSPSRSVAPGILNLHVTTTSRCGRQTAIAINSIALHAIALVTEIVVVEIASFPTFFINSVSVFGASAAFVFAPSTPSSGQEG